jgi:DNA-binding transcriptional LysR family regulator
VELTDAGRVFVQEARASLFHAERAIHLAHAAHQGVDNALLIGHSHYADRAWIPALFAIRLPLYPRLKVRLVTRSAIESVRSVLSGELDLALVTAPPEDAQMTAVAFARAPLHVALPDTHRGVGTSGIGNYYGKYGYDSLTHAKSVLISPPDVAIDHLFPPYTQEKVQARYHLRDGKPLVL